MNSEPGVIDWHDIADPGSIELDQLAAAHALHPLHVENCRQGSQRAKVDDAKDYLFVVLKLLVIGDGDDLSVGNLGLFVGSDFLITVHEQPLALLKPLCDRREELQPGLVLYRVMDAVVDSYLPVLDKLEDAIDELQDQVVGRPAPALLERIGDVRGTLMKLRRVLSNTRYVTFQLRHLLNPLISQEVKPFLRDVHDDLGNDLDRLAGERERLTSVLDVYLSSIANRNMEATRILTLLGTIALPTLVISSLFGMNIGYPAWTRSPWALVLVVILTAALTIFLLWYLQRLDYLPGTSSSRRGANRRFLNRGREIRS